MAPTGPLSAITGACLALGLGGLGGLRFSGLIQWNVPAYLMTPDFALLNGAWESMTGAAEEKVAPAAIEWFTWEGMTGAVEEKLVLAAWESPSAVLAAAWGFNSADIVVAAVVLVVASIFVCTCLLCGRQQSQLAPALALASEVVLTTEKAGSLETTRDITTPEAVPEPALSLTPEAVNPADVVVDASKIDDATVMDDCSH